MGLGGLVGKLIGLAILLVVVVVALGVYAYSTDYGLQATVKEKQCASSPPKVTVQTKQFGIKHTVDVAQQECGIIEPGNFVVYHVRSQHTIIYSKDPKQGGTCVYDTATGIC